MQFDDFRTINAQIFAYGEALRDFVDQYNLPEEWFEQLDHAAFKCKNSEHFDEVLMQATDDADQLSFVAMDGRRLAGAHLEEPVYVESFGYFEWLEIMQPRPERVGKDIVGLEHLEFYWPDFEAAEEVLRDRGIQFEMQHNDSQQWISIILNNFGHELKLCNRTLADIVQEELANGDAESIL